MINDPAKPQSQQISRKHDKVVGAKQIIMTSKHIPVLFKINHMFRF
jgi:hypothetical protein